MGDGMQKQCGGRCAVVPGQRRLYFRVQVGGSSLLAAARQSTDSRTPFRAPFLSTTVRVVTASASSSLRQPWINHSCSSSPRTRQAQQHRQPANHAYRQKGGQAATVCSSQFDSRMRKCKVMNVQDNKQAAINLALLPARPCRSLGAAHRMSGDGGSPSLCACSTRPDSTAASDRPWVMFLMM